MENKIKKESIDKMRDSAFSIELNDPDDPSPMRKMIAVSGHLHIIKDDGIHLMQLPDDIDPQRTNINVPHTNKKILEYGFKNEVVQRILLLAVELFDKNFLEEDLDCECAIDHAFESTKLLLEMKEICESLSCEVKSTIEKGFVSSSGNSLNIPSVKNLETRVKTFVHKADLVRDKMIQFLKLFYVLPDGNKKLLENIKDAIFSKHGYNSHMEEFFDQIRPVLEFIRNLRNAVEHPGSDNELIIKDFNLTSESLVDPPTVELVHKDTPQEKKDTPQEKIDAVSFMRLLTESLTGHLEALIINLCSNNLRGGEGSQFGIIELPPEMQKDRGTKFSYAIKLNGEWTPIG